MFCLVPKIVSLNPDPPRDNWVIKSLFYHRKTVGFKPRQSENTGKARTKKSFQFRKRKSWQKFFFPKVVKNCIPLFRLFGVPPFRRHPNGRLQLVRHRLNIPVLRDRRFKCPTLRILDFGRNVRRDDLPTRWSDAESRLGFVSRSFGRVFDPPTFRRSQTTSARYLIRTKKAKFIFK